MKLFALALSFSFCLSACSASPKQVATVSADSVALLCKMLPPIDAAEEAICAAAISADDLVHKFAVHETEIGVERLGNVRRVSPAPSASAAPAQSAKASKP